MINIYKIAQLFKNKSIPAMQPSLYETAFSILLDKNSIYPKEIKNLYIDKLKIEFNKRIYNTVVTASPHQDLVHFLIILLVLVAYAEIIKLNEEVDQTVNQLINRCRINDKDTHNYSIPETIAFEFIFPGLIHELERHQLKPNLSLENELYLVEEEKTALHKMKVFHKEPELMFKKNPIHFTFELLYFFREKQEIIGLIEILFAPENKDKLLSTLSYSEDIVSGGLSPSSTCGLLLLDEWTKYSLEENVKDKLQSFLKNILIDFKLGMPTTHPSNSAQIHWLLFSMSMQDGFGFDHLLAQKGQFYDLIADTMNSSGGASWGGGMENEMPDLDETAAAFLNSVFFLDKESINVKLDPSVFLNFRNEDSTYFCFPFERNPSVSALLHAAIALDKFLKISTNESKNQVAWKIQYELIQQILKLTENGSKKIYDKWHTTWTYATSRFLSLETLYEKYPEVIRNQFNLLENDDNLNPEESANILLGLNNYLRFDTKRSVKLERYMENLTQNMVNKLFEQNFVLEPRWISKDLYSPLWAFGMIVGVLESTPKNVVIRDNSIINQATETIEEIINSEVTLRTHKEWIY